MRRCTLEKFKIELTKRQHQKDDEDFFIETSLVEDKVIIH